MSHSLFCPWIIKQNSLKSNLEWRKLLNFMGTGTNLEIRLTVKHELQNCPEDVFLRSKMKISRNTTAEIFKSMITITFFSIKSKNLKNLVKKNRPKSFGSCATKMEGSNIFKFLTMKRIHSFYI